MDNPKNSIVRVDEKRQASDNTLRPSKIKEFIGQNKIKENLAIFIVAAKARKEPLDHVLFHGPPGLGKTTLSYIIAKELNSNIKMTSGPMLNKTGDLAAILTNLQKDDVLFIDEIHRLNPAVEELLYSAMEDFYIDLIIGDGPAARTVKINIARFTLIGATTRLGLITNPLRDRFGIVFKLDFYTFEELKEVVVRAAKILDVAIENTAAFKIAQCSRGTPRITVKLLKRIRDFAHFAKSNTISLELAQKSLMKLGIDDLGLDILDYKYLNFIAKNYKAGPVGIDTIAAGLFEEKDTIEPYLIQIGFVARTARGRMLTAKCLSHIEYKKDINNTLF